MGPSKKTPAKAAPKKEVKVKSVKEKVVKSSVKFISLSFGATIPTQPFGNVQPSITVEASSYEEALDFVLPKIQDLYKKYAENTPSVFTKVTETVKVVAPAPTTTTEAPTQPQAVDIPAPVAQDTPAPVQTAQVVPGTSGSEFAQKARKMIGLALTEDAAEAIKTQIQNSTKIPEAEKPALIDLVDAKIVELSGTNVW